MATHGDSALLILPSQRVQAKIVPWRRLYDPEHLHMIPPHISLAYPFVREDVWPALRPALAQFSLTIRPFWIRLAELGNFQSPQAVLWFRPDDEGTLLRLHAALVEQFPAHVQPDPLPFVPHLTVGFFDSPAALAQASATIGARWQPVRFRVKRLYYAVLKPNGVWHVHDEVPLAGQRQ
jgi:2'-5' RNA ligase